MLRWREPMTAPDRSALESAIDRHLEAGDLEAAAAAVITGYGPEILSYLLAMTRDQTAADEVFSIAIEDLWSGLPGFRRESSMRTWLYRVTYNALQRYRKDPFQRRKQGLTGHLSRVAQDVRSRTAPFLRTEVKDRVARLRDQLEPDEQTLLVLRIDRQMSWRSIGAIMGSDDAPLSEATLAKRFQRLKAKLRGLAEEAGLLDEE